MHSRPPEIPPHKLISSLRQFDLLPAIIFMPTRRKCDESATEVANDKSQKTNPEKFERRRQLFESFAVENPEIRGHKHARILVNYGVASHHAGHIPNWKLLIEKMMSGGMLEAIFATSTVAAGVDFPARTVVVSNADTRGNEGWRPLTANELQQMTGRAGRRGKDNVGFVVLAPGQFQDPKRISTLLKSPPDALESQFRATYTSLLNLLDAFGSFAQVRSIAQRSFAYRKISRRIESLERETSSKKAMLTAKLAEAGLGLGEEEARGFERLTSARQRLLEAVPATRIESLTGWAREYVVPGRVVSHGPGKKRVFLVTAVSGERISALRDDGQRTTFGFDRIARIFRNIYSVTEDGILSAFSETYDGKNQPLKQKGQKERASAANAAAVEIIERAIASFSAGGKAGNDVSDKRLDFLWGIAGEAAAIEDGLRSIDHHYSEIWYPFERRARVLDRFGYLDFVREIVTPAGKWLADVRVDRPLLLGEALKRGVFDNVAEPVLAGLVASLAADSERNYGELYLSDELLDSVGALEEIIFEVSAVEWKFDIEPSEEINLSAAAAAENWATGMEWSKLVRRSGAEEGDLFRLLSRTGEAMMQIAHLNKAEFAACRRARASIDLILRAPIR